jgi:hypothetical protein
VTRTTLAGPLLWTAYTLVPIAGWGVLDGAPLGPIEAVTLFAIWWTWASSRKLPAGVLLASCLLIKIAAAAVLVPQGFAASYYANGDFTPPVERSLDHRGRDATRVDPRLSFGLPGRPDLPMYFFNDLRFNFYQRNQPHRARLPYSVAWDGYVWVEEGERERWFYLTATSAGASLEVDGAPVVTLAPGAGTARATVLWAKGWRHLVVRVAGREEPARDVEAGFVDAAGVEQPLGTDPVFRSPVSRRAMQVDRAVRAASFAIDAVLIAWLAWLTAASLLSMARRAWRERGAPQWRALAALAVLGAAAEAWWFAWPMAGRLWILPGGDDPLTYETYARDIVMNGPLMLMGGQLGQGDAFYYQPLYSYALAVVHLVFGEDFFGVFLVQRLSMCGVLLGLCWIARRLDGPRAAVVTAIVGTALFYGWVTRWAAELFTEVVFVPLVVAWACALLRCLDDLAPKRFVVMAGIAGGLAVLGRSTLLLAVPPVLLLLWFALPAGRRRAVFAIVAVMAAVVSLATVRNRVVSGTAVPITTSFSINLYLGNEPPAGVPQHPAGEHVLDRWMAGDDRSRPVFEFARHSPQRFAAQLWRKAQYAFGYFDAFVPGAGYSPVLVMWWLTALVGFIITVRKGQGEPPLPVAARILVMAIAVSMFAAIIAIFPHHVRLYLPGYLMLLPFAGVAGGRLLGLVLRTRAAGTASPIPTR